MSALTLFAIVFILFLLMEFLPGSPFNNEKLNETQVALLEAKYGLDQPFFTRFFIYVNNLIHGDFGISYTIAKDMPVNTLLVTRLPVTIRIGVQAIILGVIIGLVWGIVAALRKNTWVDTTATVFSVLGFSVPAYVFALFLAYFIAFKLGWFPIQYSMKDPLNSSILPTISLSMYIIATDRKSVV